MIIKAIRHFHMGNGWEIQATIFLYFKCYFASSSYDTAAWYYSKAPSWDFDAYWHTKSNQSLINKQNP